MKRKIFIITIMIIFITLISSITCYAATSINDLKNKFPDGKYWNHPSSGNNPDGYSSTACTHHDNCGYYPDNCKCNSFSNAIQCHGFALKLGYDYYGSNPRNWGQGNINSIKPGDIIEYYVSGGTHTIWVTGVNGNTITCAECNWGGNCLIKWGRTVSKSSLSVKQIMSAPYAASTSTFHNPEGYFDSCTGGAGVITLSGWAFDRDDTSAALDIHVYIGGDAGIAGSEGHVIRANKVRSDVNSVTGVGGNHGFSETITTSKRGTQVVNVHAINIGGGEHTKLGTKTVNITNPPAPGKPTLKMSGTSPFVTGSTVNFSWGATANTVCYDLKIYDWANPANLVKQVQGIQGTSYGINLPKGNYSAVLFSKNTIGSTEGNWIPFQIFDRAAAPVITPSNYVGGKTVTLTCATKGATIYYTKDGSNPTTSSAKYTAPFKVEKNTTVKAIAVASGYTNSKVASSTVNVPQHSAPTITESDSGTGKTITISAQSQGTTIYYTTDGSNPTTSSAKYTAPFNVNKNMTIKAICVASGYANSTVTSKDIKVMQSVDINPNGGMINGETDSKAETKDYGTTLDLIPTPPEGYDFAGFTADGEGVIMPYGKPLFKDTLFENGVNGIAPYNNGDDGKDAINIERVPASEDCPTNSDYMVKIQSVGKTFPEYGGFCQKVNAKANGIFYHIIVAKIPKGYMIQQDGGGGGKYSTWQKMGNSCYGTGEWKTYIFKHTCGTTGDFSTVGEVHIARVSNSDWHNWETIDSSQEENPMTWYVAYSNMFDATDITSNRTKDPSFTTSNNGIREYNNENNGAVTIQREAMEGDSNKYVLKITTDGTSVPGYGGFIQPTGSKPNRVYYHFFSAKVPKGYTLNIAYNPCGDNSKHIWITDNKGTGEWANYIYKTECGATGKFSSFGHVFLTKNEDAVPTEEPLIWYVRYSDMVDMTPQYIFNGTGTLTARWSKQRCSKPTAGIKTESVILTSTPITLTGEEGADIYYTLDGTSPTSADELYTEPIYLPEGDVNLKAVAFKEGCTESYYADYNYHVYSDTLEMSTDISTTKSYHNVFSEFTDPVPGTYIAAFYDENDVLLQTFTREVEENTDVIEFRIPRIEDAVYAKIFLWDKLKNMRPLLESERININ